MEDLRRKGAADPAWFWEAMVGALGVTWTRPPRAVLDAQRGLPWARWFPGAGYNYCTQALDRWVAAGRAGCARPALARARTAGRRTLTYGAALAETQRVANALLGLGLRRGDRVGVFMPLTLECALAILACARIGAIFTPIFSGYGAGAVATRLTDSGARLLITADGFFRRGRLVEMKEVADAAVAGAPGVERVLVVHRAQRPKGSVPWTAGRDVWWEDVVPAQAPACPAVDTDAGRALHDHLHQRDDRAPQRGPPRPRRLPAQGGRRPVPLLRRAAGRPACCGTRTWGG